MLGRLRGCARSDEEGMTLIELAVALSLLAVAMVGLDLMIGLSYKIVTLSRQRQVAEATANRRLEEWRDVDYDQLSLAAAPAHTADASYPDHGVSADGTTFDVTGKGDDEPLIVDTVTPGPVPHVESPVTVGTTVVDVYNYVTWVDDPDITGTQDLKRVTVVVRYRDVAVKGTARTLRESVLFTPGTITVPGGSSVTTSTTSTTTPSSTTTTPGNSGCGGFTVSGGSGAGTGFTGSPTVTLTMNLTPGVAGCDNLIANFSNDGVTYGPDVSYDPNNPTVGWSLSTGDGAKTVYGKLHNSTGSWVLDPQGISLDTVRPSSPGTLSRSASCSGSTRTVHLSWGAATDTNFVGYRLYRSTDGVTWQVIPPTYSALTGTDSTSKTLTSVRYYVTAYDKAGNESLATNTITLSKNQCS
jgi:hypothetical protein